MKSAPALLAATWLGATTTASDLSEIPGAVRIPLQMPIDGKATVALYTPEGRLVRPLAQLIDLKAGRHEVRWDGMDLWGNLVAAGTDLDVKLIASPGLKAYYEFTVGHANSTPWLTKPVGEGLAMRTGGWMGDHSPPQSVVAVGDKLFFGCTVAEHGHALIATDLEGDKLWGINGLEGWSGPAHMATDGKFIYCDAKEKDVYRVNVETYEKKRLMQTGEQKVRAIAVHDGQVLVMLQTPDGKQSMKIIKSEDGTVLKDGVPGEVTFVAAQYDGAGTLWVITSEGNLCKGTPTSLAVIHTARDLGLKKPVSLALTAERIIIGDDELCAVLIFDRQGKLLHTLGNKGPRKPGPWDPQVIQRPTGVALDKNGKVWVTECLYVPKRIARFSADGKCEKEFFGPAEYGGGGYLDSNLNRFYYRSMEYALDLAKGTWQPLNLNDHIANPYTPAPQGGGFTYTTIGRPIYHNGHRYLVNPPERGDGFQVCLLDDGMTAWRPCAVMKSAVDSTTNRQTRVKTFFLPTFLKKSFWADHWQKKFDAGELKDKSFIWCDRNGDGQQQLDEVELFDNKPFRGDPFGAPFFGNWCGPDLVVWTGRARLAPSRFTDKGVPIYESRNMRPFDYAKLAPVYRRSFTVRSGATANAKPDYGGTSIIAADGSLVLEGQPYLVKPDLALKGGPLPGYVPPVPRGATQPTTRSDVPSDFVPPIHGRIMDQPLHFVGSAMTRSPVGEVAMLNGNNGQWFLWGVQDCVLLGEIFTGKDGSWSTDLKPQRGMDVTGRKQDWECFFGHFTRGDDGRYYVVAGHAFHAISRVEHLDDLAVTGSRIRVPADSIAANAQLRQALSRREAAKTQPAPARTLTVPPLAKRSAAFKLDGDLADWGGKLQPLGEAALDLAFDAAWDKDHLYLAYRGKSYTGNTCENVNLLFKTGFSFDIQFRGNVNAKAKDVTVGDRRIVFGQHKGRWVAVLYDYIDPATAPDRWVEFSSPLITTRVARVAVLDDARIAVKQKDPGAVAEWSAEVALPWKAMGIAPQPKGLVLADVGILTPDSGGVRVEKRTYWSNRATDMVADLGMEAQIHPSAWGQWVWGD